MRQDKSVRAFKNQLENYQYYVYMVNHYEQQIQDCFDKLGASPKSIDYSKVVGHTVPDKDFEYKMRGYIEIYEYKKDMFERLVAYVNSILDLMPVEQRNMAKDMFVLGENEIAVAKKYYISPSGMRYQINREIKKALDNS